MKVKYISGAMLNESEIYKWYHALCYVKYISGAMLYESEIYK